VTDKDARKVRQKFLAPAGPAVEVRFSTHATERWEQRLRDKGVTREDLIAHVRQPVGKKKDEIDPAHGFRVRRWSNVMIGGKFQALRIVLEVLREASPTDPGSVLIRTVVPVDKK
jgi:hypothetical protein